jgi:hypothetical protein
MTPTQIVQKFRAHLKEGFSVRKAAVLTALAADVDIQHVSACVFEAKKKKMKMKDDPCWDGYEMVGKKKKGGKEVPNCVPESAEPDADKKPDEDKDGIPDWADRNPKRKAPAFIDRKKAK